MTPPFISLDRTVRILRVYPGGHDPRHRGRERALARAGVQVGLVLPREASGEWATAAVEPTITAYPSRVFNARSVNAHLWDPWRFRAAVHDFEPDVVDVHEEYYFPCAAELVALSGRRPTVVFASQNIVKRLPRPLDWMTTRTLGRVSAVYACTSQAGALVRRKGFERALHIIPLGVDEELFTVSPHGGRVGFIGRFVPEKGVRDLYPLGSQLLCVGGGPLAAEIKAHGCDVRVARSAAALAQAFRELSVLAVPSRTTGHWKEQFGRVAVEAMAASVPVVAYDSGSLRDVIGDAGVLVPEGDAQALRCAIARTIAEPGDLGARGRARASALYTWDVVAAQMVEMYEAVSR